MEYVVIAHTVILVLMFIDRLNLKDRIKILEGCESNINRRLFELEARLLKLKQGGKRTRKKGKKPLDKPGF